MGKGEVVYAHFPSWSVVSLLLCTSCSGLFNHFVLGASGDPVPTPLLEPRDVAITSDRPLVATDVRQTPPVAIDTQFRKVLPDNAGSLPVPANFVPGSILPPPALVDLAGGVIPASQVSLDLTYRKNAPDFVRGTSIHNSIGDFTVRIDAESLTAAETCSATLGDTELPCSFPNFMIEKSALRSGSLRVQTPSVEPLAPAAPSLPAERFKLAALGIVAPGQVTPFDGRHYFVGSGGDGLQHVFSSDGLDLRQHTALNSTGGDDPYLHYSVNGGIPGQLFFAARNASNGRKMYATNGQDLRQITQLNPPGSDFGALEMTMPGAAVSGRYFFVSGNNNKLYSSDGTDLRQHTDLRPGSDDFGFATRMAVLGNRLYFTGQISAGSSKLFSTDGTDLRQHTDISPLADDAIAQLRVFGARLYFVASNALYSTDGTDLIRHLGPFSSLTIMGEFNSRLLLDTATPSTAGNRKLFSTDGTDLVQLSDTAPGSDDGIAMMNSSLIELDGRVYFVSTDAGGFAKLHSYGPSGVRQHTNLNATGSDSPYNLTAFDGRVYFRAETALGTTKLYSTQGTDLWQHGNANPAGSDLTSGFSTAFTPYKGRLFFTGAADPSANVRMLATNGRDLIQFSENRAAASDYADSGTCFMGDFFAVATSRALLVPLCDEGGIAQLYRLCSADDPACTN